MNAPGGAPARVSVRDAARELGVNEQCVRERMKRGIWDIGHVVTPKQKRGATYSYYIYRDKLDAFLGKRQQDGERQGDGGGS